MKTSRQQQRRSAPGDVAPPVQKYSDRECMLWPSSFCGAISPRCGLTNYSPYAMRYFRISTARAVRRSRSSTRTSCLRSGRSHRDDLAWSPGTSSLPPANSWAGYSTIFGPASRRCRRACGNPLACRDRRRRGRLNGATTRRSCVSTWGTGAPAQSRQPQTCWCDGGRNSGAANTSRAACGFCRRTGVSVITTPGVHRRPGINDSSRRGTTKPNTRADTTAHARPLGTTHQKEDAALRRGSAVDRRAGRRRGPPAGTERLRRVRLPGTSASEWDMEGR